MKHKATTSNATGQSAISMGAWVEGHILTGRCNVTGYREAIVMYAVYNVLTLTASLSDLFWAYSNCFQSWVFTILLEVLNNLHLYPCDF